jgi:phenylacetate-CoA ligase
MVNTEKPLSEGQETNPAANDRSDYEARCLETLETALNRTSIYRSWKGLDPGPRHSADLRYHALPVLTKEGIRAHFPYGLVPQGLDLDAALAAGEVSFVSTSGTADEALQNIWNQQWWNASERASWKLNSVAATVATGSHPEAILASALSVGPRSQEGPIGREKRVLGRFLFLNEFATPAEWPQKHECRMLEELFDYRPAVLEANPSYLARLARFVWKTGRAVYQPPLITLTYEFPSALQLRDIRRVFHSPIASSYGSTEAGYVLMECEHGKLHQNSEFCRIDFAPLGVNGPAQSDIGRLFVTTFGNRWFPLLRFDIGDLGRIAPEPCPCGRNSGLIFASIEGRLKSLCVGSDGRLITHRQIDEALAAVQGLVQYRLVQESPQRVRIAAIAENGTGKQITQDATDILRSMFGKGVKIAAEEVQTLPAENSGKFLLAKRDFPLDPLSAPDKTEVLHG